VQISDQEKKPHAITNQEKKLFLVDKESNWLWVLLFPSYGFATASNKFIDKRESSLNGRTLVSKTNSRGSIPFSLVKKLIPYGV
tara:strand:+ start:55 stop:306 length:252 start_codon:yes stop_codon:yes gene_type:complete